MENTRKFDRCLRNLLTLSGTSRTELACYLGVTVPVLNRWLNGVTAPDVYQFRAVARYFGIPYTWFLDDNVPDSAELAALLGLSEDTVKGLLALAEGENIDVLDSLDDAIYAMVSAVNAAQEGYGMKGQER